MKKGIVLLLLSCCCLILAQEKPIKQLLYAQQEAWNRGDLEGFMHGYWRSDSLLFIGKKGPVFGWQTTLDNYKKGYPDRSRMGTLKFSNLRVRALAPTVAMAWGRWEIEREKDPPSGIFSLVLKKIKNQWRIVADHTQ